MRHHYRTHHHGSPRDRHLRVCAREVAVAFQAVDSAPSREPLGLLEFAERVVDLEDAWDQLLQALAA